MSMNFITLRQILDDFILTLDGDDYVSTASDVAIRNFALRGIRELGFDVTSKIKSLKRTVQSNDTVTLPDDSGFLAIPSTALLMPMPCPRLPPKAAMAMPKPAANTETVKYFRPAMAISSPAA